MSMKWTQFQPARLGAAVALAAAALALAPAAHAQRVAKDAATGQLRPATADEAKVLDAASVSAKSGRLAAQPRGLLTGKVAPQPITHADGTVEQELDESSLSYSVLVRNADGTMETVCVTGKEAADAVVYGKTSVAKSTAKKAHNHDHK